ncbi:MAG: sulfur carrier protein ThiS [Sphingopyxis sp.]|nr:sulfur carrier protein ThiS [Sphingopyxis sp.]
MSVNAWSFGCYEGRSPYMGCSAKGKARRQTVISVILNGEARQVREGSVADLVASLGLDVQKVAVERNRAIVPRSTLADVALAQGDALEIVHFVGGG